MKKFLSNMGYRQTKSVMNGNIKGGADKTDTEQHSKYGAVKTEVDGIVFDSKKEARYYSELKLLQKGKVVESFEMQVPYVLQEGFRHPSCKRKVMPIIYIADFVVHYRDGHTEVVDVKGYRTSEYILKKKLLLHQNPEINFKEV